MKVGFIGLGNMGSALALAVSKTEGVEVLLSNHNQNQAEKVQAQAGGRILSNSELVQQADVIFVGVKPHVLFPLLKGLEDRLQHHPSAVWISMAAGISLEQLSQHLPASQIVRIMPNTPVAIGQGMTTYALINPELAAVTEQLLSKSGQVKQVEEKLMDTATALAGCGPAFVYQWIEAMMDAGVAHGLTADDAKYLAAQTLLGSAQMVLNSSKHPAQLRQEVTSPGGSTIAGVVKLEKEGLRYAILSAVKAAIKRTKELGRKTK
ncbi:pyrroline-5-carboxylate reductase [Streptococcus acidominimus]|uniref:Pyrroline-5-carboxylate reductase n=1 Tax=Streptococcus acidominimus TaxID=1326 RepID=A0A4Y9FQ64_STRAI|nr:pyrroline-5-carboxylate reductase [Streptococcus acidominimus]MBF0818506.1 pyrroline-5-carboxylate reductase [Streptococcus acidominimus]MBF0839085.1 pyrroline-5-carboxylate reductase [Streptococcus acidominimus]MBF0848746.1 pyrroline-5-carboxylate reductase [Streptococcus danieliae]TFU31146.1 pyrroline-5-carboxylate reductase [Streptococcus acidominimus]